MTMREWEGTACPSAHTESESPNATEIRARREAAQLTQTSAGVLVHSSLRAWQQWEAGDRKMHPGLWELFLIKTSGKAQARKA